MLKVKLNMIIRQTTNKTKQTKKKKKERKGVTITQYVTNANKKWAGQLSQMKDNRWIYV